MEQSIYNWGFLGYGLVAREHMAPALLAHPRSRIGAIASHSADLSSIPADTFYNDYRRLLDDKRIDIVYIALPNSMHAQWAIDAMLSGKHVLCEKPIAMSINEIEMIQEVSLKTGRKIMEGFMYRYSSRFNVVEDYLNRQVLGDVLYIQSNFISLRSRMKGIRVNKDLGGGSLWDLGCYPISLISALLGKEGNNDVLHIQAIGNKMGDVDAYLAGEIGFSDGTIGSFSCGWLSNVRNIMTTIIGTKGIIEVERLFNWDEGFVKVNTEQGTEKIILPAEDPFMKEVDAFLDYIEEGIPLCMSLEESKRLIALLCKTAESIIFL